MKQLLRKLLPSADRQRGIDPRRAERILEIADQESRHGSSAPVASEWLALRRLVEAGTPWHDEAIVLRAFVLVAVAIQRSLGWQPYQVQLLAGLAMTRACIAEMQTGEGKTLATVFPAALFSLAGRGVHVMTVNAYLAERDYEIVKPLLAHLGIQAGLLRPDDDAARRRAAYLCPISYGPGYEFGFDYLRDQLLLQDRAPDGADFDDRLADPPAAAMASRQRGHAFAIIDEADSVLIDEATTPLVISDHTPSLHPHPEPYRLARELAASLQPGKEFAWDARSGVRLLPEVRRQMADVLQSCRQRCPLQRPWMQYIEQAVLAHHVLRRDVDYVVDGTGVRIVDKDTGRIFSDRTWQDGLHQAVEAKEQLPIMAESRTAARIARQRYFQLYGRLCGLTGTAASSAGELADVYGLEVTPIPLRTPSRRVVERTRCFVDFQRKWDAIVDDVYAKWQRGQPVLIGTGTIQQSEELARRLEKRFIPFRLLNGRQTAEEAAVIADAGQRGAVTVATNMAGRGTDIRLGPGVAELGGLHVVAAQRHESERVDRQLIGRCARQGDPGSCQFFVSADDRLIKLHSPILARQMQRLARENGEIYCDLSAQIRTVQNQAERAARLRRQELAQHDEWLTELVAQL
ncbi:MAG: preprotein translocase subunit SecA [Pirellulaceae bacterium]